MLGNVSDVWIEEFELKCILDTSSKSSDLVRKLLTHLIGDEVLKTMTLSGGGNWHPIPDKIMKAVQSN